MPIRRASTRSGSNSRHASHTSSWPEKPRTEPAKSPLDPKVSTAGRRTHALSRVATFCQRPSRRGKLAKKVPVATEMAVYLPGSANPVAVQRRLHRFPRRLLPWLAALSARNLAAL